MQHSNIQKRHFTLVELMVAMGVLVIMMGFLFQFTIGAQRIWNASSKQTVAFSSAHVLLDILNDDLQNMRYSKEDGETMPFYLHKDSSDNVIMGFFSDFVPSTGILDSDPSDGVTTADLSQVGTYLVVYYFDKSAKTIHRCSLDRKKYERSSGTPISFTNLWGMCGMAIPPSVDFFEQFKNNFLSGASLNQFDTLAENVEELSIDVFFGNDNDEAAAANKSFAPSSNTFSKHYASVKPLSIRINFTMETDTNAKANEVTKRAFSKVIFL